MNCARVIERRNRRGFSLIDAVVGIAIMVIVFVGISGVFQLGIELVSNNKSRIGALTLAQERLEYIRSLSYDDVGTVQGIPSGNIPPIETIALNGTSYTRRVLVLYRDDPKDGTAGADVNGITADYKDIKVEVSWVSRGVLRTTALTTRMSPIGIEQAVPGGTLFLTVTDASGTAVQGATVAVVNASTSINTSAQTNASGTVMFIGTPQGTGYQISVTKTGYSSAYTYTASTTNPSPSPGHLTVSNNQTTSVTFSIDRTSDMTIRTFEAIQPETWTDTFVDGSKVYASASTTVSSGALILDQDAGDYYAAGSARATPVSSAYLAGWNEARFSAAHSGNTSVRVYVYADDTGTLVPDAVLPGNSAGFTTSPIDLQGISTSTYPTLRLGAALETTDPTETPSVSEWYIEYDEGPVPLPSLPVVVTGQKTIGTNAGSPVYKYSATHTSNGSGVINLPTAEWDVYTMALTGTTYSLAESCGVQPVTVSPNTPITTSLHVLPYTAHTLLVDVRDATGGYIASSSVRLQRSAYDETEVTGGCGQAFFGGLSSGTVGAGTAYTVTVTASGYQAYSSNAVDVSGQSRLSVILTP